MLSTTTNTHRLVVSTLVALSVAFSLSAALSGHLPGEPQLTQVFQSSAPGSVEPVMVAASWIGGVARLLSMLAGVPVILSYTKRQYALGPALAGVTFLLSPVVKFIIQRARPSHEVVDVYSDAFGYSFPSGHAYMSFVAFGLVFYLARYLPEHVGWLTTALRTLAVFAIVAIGASRVYLGVHWASDVVGGWLLGSLVLAVLVPYLEHRARRLRSRR
jgi:undecaprenyl-diphosphatase